MSSDQETTIDKNYMIPKRKSDEMMNGPPFGGETTFQNSVLASSYYNNFYQSRGFSTPWSQGQMYPQYPMHNTVEPITQNICNTLSHIKEKPKNQKRDIFKETVPDVDDDSLPKELTQMFQPLFCKLCTAQLSSNVMAKLHYKSKNHEKKIRKFLVEFSERTGEPLHKRARIAGTPKTEEDKNPRWFHCEICDLKLTGKMHAESHYMGRNHQKAMMGHRMPAGRGHYNPEGKWVRETKNDQNSTSGSEDNATKVFRPFESDVPKPSSSASTNGQQKFHCSICDINTTCQEQIEMHYKGQKHMKKLKQLDPSINIVKSPKPGNVIETSKMPSDNINLSVYRTPSGDFYCPNCNLTLNSEPQFKLHLRSRGHMKKTQHKQHQN